MTKPVLITINLDKEIRVKADASDFVIRGILSIKCEDKKQRPVAYISKSLNKVKRNYEIHNKEILAIIRYLEVLSYFLERTKDQFEIWMDYKNLEYFMKAQRLN